MTKLLEALQRIDAARDHRSEPGRYHLTPTMAVNVSDYTEIRQFIVDTAWFLPKSSVNDIQTKSIETLIKRTKQAHFVNVRLRINGQWEEYEADWIKHLQTAPTTQAPNK